MKKTIFLVALFLTFCGKAQVTVSTLAGTGAFGNVNGTGTAASFYAPCGVLLDATGNVYVADSNNNKIRKITPSGVVTDFAGVGGIGTSVDGTVLTARFQYPTGLAFDASGTMYVADSASHLIRKITPTGDVTTLAGGIAAASIDGTGNQAGFYFPYDVAVDTAGNVFVVEISHRIRKITPAGVVTTFAGGATSGSTDGLGTAAKFNAPQGIAIDASDNLYVADTGNNKIRKITPDGNVTTIAGSGSTFCYDGTGTAATFYSPIGIDVDSSGNIYVGDASNHCIRKISPTNVVTTLAGKIQNHYGIMGSTDGVGTVAQFYQPNGVAVDAAGNVFVADKNNHKIRKISQGTMVANSFETLNDIAIYPNPTSKNVTIDFSNFNKANLKVIDVSGREIMQQALESNSNSINVEKLPSGIYFFEIITTEGTSTKKVIKE